MRILLPLLLLFVALAGCSITPNPDFPQTRAAARAELEAMAEHPVPAERPVVLIAGWADFLVGMKPARKTLATALEDADMIDFRLPFFGSFDGYRERVIAGVDEAFPTDDPARTVPVDVVAHSMGGLAARYAAMPATDAEGRPRRTLNVRRLFTISTPHRGARVAWLNPLEPAVRDMRPGSGFLKRLDAALPGAGYELVSYVRRGDLTVGSTNAAPPGLEATWVDPPWYSRAHGDADRDPRILADIARRLRGEAADRGPAKPKPATVRGVAGAGR